MGSQKIDLGHVYCNLAKETKAAMLSPNRSFNEEIAMKTIFALFVVLFASMNVSADVTYTITDLGTLGGISSDASGINSSGQVTGYIVGGGPQRTFLYSNGSMEDLGPIIGQSIGIGINNSGNVVGTRYVGGASRAFLYSNGMVNSLDSIGGFGSVARGINSSDQIVGRVALSDGDHAFLYSHDVAQDLGRGFASGINDSGQTVGSLSANGGSYPFLYSDGTIYNLGTLGGNNGGAYAINSSGQIVGFSNPGNISGVHAFLYSGSSMQDLGTFGGINSVAYSINTSGQIVGNAETSNDGTHAFVYSNGLLQDLNSLLNNPIAGWTLQSANAINDSGQIVGQMVNGFQSHAFLLTPVPSPSTLALLGLGSMTQVRKRRR